MRIYGKSALDEYREQLASGKAVSPPERAFKQYVAEDIKAVDGEKRQIRFRITTSSPDRMKDTIAADGWDLKHYKKNPVVLFAHSYQDLPIARALKIEKDETGLSSVAEFATKEQYAFAETVYQLILGGFLKATSVGFRPLKHAYNETRGGIDFLEQELLEYSIVPVPANAEALMEAEAKGIDCMPMKEWLTAMLDSAYDEPGVWVPRRQVEKMLAAVPDLAKVISIPPARGKDGYTVSFTDRNGVTTSWTGSKPFMLETPVPARGKQALGEKITASIKAALADGVLDEALDEALTKKPPECPRGGACPKQPFDATCPAKDCPIMGAADTTAPDPAVIGQRGNPLKLELADEIVLDILDDDPDLIPIDAETMTRLIDARLRIYGTRLREEVAREITATINRLKGRVD